MTQENPIAENAAPEVATASTAAEPTKEVTPPTATEPTNEPVASLEKKLTNSKMELVHEPGRIDTLTADQEQKLKDMWAQILMYTGALPKDLKAVPSALSSHTGSEKKKKRSKRSYFGFGSKEQAPELTQSEQEAKSLKDALGDVTGQQVNDAFFTMLKADHPDNLLLRFLRARKWDVKAALHMVGETLAWRLEHNVEDILRLGELDAVEKGDNGFLLQLRSKKSYIRGHDYRGRAVVHVKVHHHDPKTQTQEDIQKYTLFLIENARLCLRDPVDTAAVLFDLSKFSIHNMDNGAVKFIIQCFEGHYPESLGVLMIHKAPWVFSGIWNIVKGWLDPVVAGKIHFTHSAEDLAEFISMDHIGEELGGNGKHVFEYIEPVAGENDLMKDTATAEKLAAERKTLSNQFVEETITWIKSDSKETNKSSQMRKNALAKQLRDNYWLLDPYVRARTVFDRNGSIGQFQVLHEAAAWK